MNVYLGLDDLKEIRIKQKIVELLKRKKTNENKNERINKVKGSQAYLNENKKIGEESHKQLKELTAVQANAKSHAVVCFI